jgi:hypothetical protein
MGTAVSASVAKSGSGLAGTITKIVVVMTAPGNAGVVFLGGGGAAPAPPPPRTRLTRRPLRSFEREFGYA